MQWFYWEALDLGRRIVLTGALLVIRDSRITFRLVVALLTSLLWLTLLVSTYPFKRIELDALSIASSLMLVCMYIGALLIKLRNDLRANFAVYIGVPLTDQDLSDAAVETMSFNSPDTILFLMTCFTLGVLALIICVLGRQLWARRRTQTLRLASGARPELELRKGHFWHLFLSHGETRARLEHAPRTRSKRTSLILHSNPRHSLEQWAGPDGGGEAAFEQLAAGDTYFPRR